MDNKEDREQSFVVGIGASAGGLEALRNVLSYLPKSKKDFAIVIAQHISPDYKSKMVELLSSVCSWPVQRANNNEVIKVGNVYVTPPDYEIKILNNKIRLKKHVRTVHAIPSIDNFFISVAQEYGNHAIAVILSGTGKDGSKGVVEIKEQQGFVLAQRPEEAAHPSMPSQAIDTGVVDEICGTAHVAERISAYIQNFGLVKNNPVEEKDSLAVILEILENRYRTDFSKYKSSTINRRVEKRINDLQITSIDDYYLKIKKSPQELEKLYQTILIGVTDFFRDPKAFNLLREKINVRIENSDKKTLRLWSVGCASGEEPYSLAILVAEILGERLREYTIQIFATDIDERALSVARKGYYPKESLQNLPSEYLDKYFKKINGGYEVIKVIRHMVLFSKHDITVDPPFVKLDFVTCRNLLIYFKQELQKDVIPLFHYALNSGGYLLLGNSENVAQISNLFYKSEKKEKLFLRKDEVELNTMSFRAYRKNASTNKKGQPLLSKVEMSLEDIAKETLIKTFEHPYVVLDEQMETCLIKGSLHPFLDLSEGVINSNILKIIHHSLHTELRTLYAKVKKNGTSAKSNIIRFDAHGCDIYVQLIIKPLLYRKSQKNFFLLIFQSIDAEERYPFNKDMLSDKEFKEGVRIVELEQELNASREHLQTFTEELETSNEELQTLNEELQSSNEELKSTNEELETSNEELQSTNEELQTANSELNISNETLQRKENELQESQNELKKTNRRFEMLLSNSNIFMAYQDLELRYEWVYNQSKQYSKKELYGYSDDQLFDGSSSASSFIEIKKQVLKTEKEAFSEIFFQNNYWKIRVRPWYENDKLRGVLVLAMNVTNEKNTLQALELRNRSINSLIEGTGDYVLIVDNNYSLQVISQRLKGDLINQGVNLKMDISVKELLEANARLRSNLLVPLTDALNGKKHKVEDFQGIRTEKIKYHYSLRVFPIKNESGKILGAALIGTEITNLLRAKNRTQEALKRGAQLTEVDYFKDLTQQLYELFGCKYTYVGVIDDDKQSITTTAIRINGKLASNFSYALEDVPCETVNITEEIQFFKDVEEAFPKDPKLKKWDVDSYIGVPISSPISGEMLGIIVLISDRSIGITSDDEYLLTILSLRAGAELLREQTNRELQYRDEQLRKITSNSPDVIYEFELTATGSGNFTYVSEAVKEIYELEPKEILSDPERMFTCIHEEDFDEFKTLQEINIDNPKPLEWTGRIVTAISKTLKWVKISSRPDILEDGKVIWYGIIDDITAQKETEQQLQAAKLAAEEAASAKEDFLATMSHEIRTPLNAIYGITELLKLEHSEMMYLDILRYSTENLLSLINNILDFSKIKSGKFEVNKEAFQLHKLLDNLTKSLKFQAALKNNKVVLDIGKNFPDKVNGDELILSQILNNLLINANKFTVDGTITLKATLSKETANDVTVLFEVQDSGSGIKPEELELIFEKFEQATHNRGTKGTGLGLTITKAFLDLQNSEIKVDSTLGEGSRFYFELEFEKTEKKKSKEKKAIGSKNGTEKKPEKKVKAKILLVEDTEDNRTLVLAYFKKRHEHIKIETAENGKEALEMLRDKSYDLVLMDIRMPGINGDRATETIRGWEDPYYKKLPIIAMTADTYGINEESGFTDVVLKPFKFSQLYKSIEKNIS